MPACRLLLGVFFLVAFATPRAAHAGLVDIIWEMSGPHLWGAGVHCDLFSTSNLNCRLLDVFTLSGTREDTTVWGIIDVNGYVSMPKNAKDRDRREIDFRLLRIAMVGVDPMIGFGRYEWGSVTFHHAVGASLNFFFGSADDTDAFIKTALKIRPVALEFPLPLGAGTRMEVAYNGRLYSDGFDSQADRRPLLQSGDNVEWVHGASVTFRF